MSRPKRVAGFTYLGPRRYFLTCCCYLRRRSFDHADAVADTLGQFRSAAVEYGFANLASCFMPDHGHWLVEGLTAEADFRKFVKIAKQRSGFLFAKQHPGPLWQEGYFERILRAEEDSRAVARYIIANPVRAGIVDDARRYPHIASDRWSIDELLATI